MSQLFIQSAQFKLSGSGMTSTATSFDVVSFKTPDGVTIVTADLGSGVTMTSEPGTSREEIIRVTAVVQNADGTATLTTSLTDRGLNFKSPYTSDASRRFNHAGGTGLVISNNPQLYEDLISFNNDETVTSTFTFTNPKYPRIDSAVTAPTADEQFATKKYVDETAGGAAVSKNREVVAGTAGEVVTTGQIVYLKPSDQRWYLADASVSSTAENIKFGIAQGGGAVGGGIAGGVLLSGLDNNQAGLTVGKQFLSDTAGALSNVAGTVEVSLGIAETATSIVFAPNYDQGLTSNQKSALAGDNGTPSSSNLYVTQTGLQRSTETYAVDSVGTDAYAITLSPAPTAYVAGMTVKVKFGTPNTGSATIDVNGLGAKSITKSGSTALATGDISANQVSLLVYDGTQFQISGAVPISLTDGSDAGGLHFHAHKRGTGTRLLTSGIGNETIAHGLGRIPKFLRVIAYVDAGGNNEISSATATGTTDQGGLATASYGAASIHVSIISFPSAGSASLTTLDATNIVMNFISIGANIRYMWEVS